MGCVVLMAGNDARAGSFTLFESGQVRPLALSPGGAFLSPSTRRTIGWRSSRSPPGPTHLSSIPVGLEPVAVSARSDDEVWVVNHLSDSVSVVRLAPSGRRASCAHAAGGRRAAGHRLRRAGQGAAPSSPRPTAGRTCPLIRSSPRRASAAPTSGSSTPTTRALAGRQPAHDRQPLQRHAARARGDAGRLARLRRRRSTRATAPPSSPSASSPTGARRPAASRARTSISRASRARDRP